MSLVFFLNILGPALASTLLTWTIFAPQEIRPLWPIFIAFPLTIGLTVLGQKLTKRYFSHNATARVIGRMALYAGLATGPIVFFFGR